MPEGVKDHAAWERAKRKAKEEGKENNWAYIREIYQNMKDENEKEGSVTEIGDAVENIYQKVSSDSEKNAGKALDKTASSSTIESGQASTLRKFASEVKSRGIHFDKKDVNKEDLFDFAGAVGQQ